METREETRDDPREDSRADAPQPGVAVVSEGAPAWRTAPVGSAPVIIGRAAECGLSLRDDLASREHVSVAWAGGQWTVKDLGSRNGSFLDGERLDGAASGPWRCLRVGNTLLMPIADLRTRGPVREDDGRIVGAGLAAALDRIKAAAAASRTLMLLGESGTGKELAAQAFHQAARPKGPLKPVNCAAIPHSVAERLFFGAKKGAYSDAKENAQGYFQAAHKGVLFLDEVGELDLEVQAKLLRVLETGEVLPLGAVETEKVDALVCFATNRDLEAAVAAGKLRGDLYYRVAQPQVRLPPLRERAEEIPWHVAAELRRAGSLKASARFLEACLVRDWPGNVRELLAEVRAAAGEAQLAKSDQVRPSHLRATAGESKVAPAIAPVELKPAVSPKQVTKEQVQQALEAHGGKVAAAARALGLHRTQLYRLMDEHGLKRDKA